MHKNGTPPTIDPHHHCHFVWKFVTISRETHSAMTKPIFATKSGKNQDNWSGFNPWNLDPKWRPPCWWFFPGIRSSNFYGWWHAIFGLYSSHDVSGRFCAILGGDTLLCSTMVLILMVFYPSFSYLHTEWLELFWPWLSWPLLMVFTALWHPHLSRFRDNEFPWRCLGMLGFPRTYAFCCIGHWWNGCSWWLLHTLFRGCFWFHSDYVTVGLITMVSHCMFYLWWLVYPSSTFWCQQTASSLILSISIVATGCLVHWINAWDATDLSLLRWYLHSVVSLADACCFFLSKTQHLTLHFSEVLLAMVGFQFLFSFVWLKSYSHDFFSCVLEARPLFLGAAGANNRWMDLRDTFADLNEVRIHWFEKHYQTYPKQKTVWHTFLQ